MENKVSYTDMKEFNEAKAKADDLIQRISAMCTEEHQDCFAVADACAHVAAAAILQANDVEIALKTFVQLVKVIVRS